MLAVLKIYCTWSHHGLDFGLIPSNIQKIVMKMMNIVSNRLSEWQIQSLNMEKLDKAQTRSTHYPCALYAPDMKFEQSSRPSGSHEEVEDYFSQKHKLYGYKQISVYRRLIHA